jgi:DNA-binding Xre family transcriptional regulator
MQLRIENIKQIAENKGIALQLLASKIGVTESGLHAMFKKGDMKLSTLEKIAEVLETSIESMINYMQQPANSSKNVYEDKPKYESALEKCNKEVDQWRSKAIEYLEKYNQLLEEQLQQRNRPTK